jgi:signal peptidase I
MTDAPAKPETSVKETLTSIMISFIVALVFRGFVIEGFQIPTGSMGPTLLGAHVDVHSDLTGYEWPLEPWHYIPNSRTPAPQQPGMAPTDPIAGTRLVADDYTKRSGDRVFVFKYLRPFYNPHRWDVTVFKVPTRTQENYIKRMVGLPGEQLAFVDGDVFTRPNARTVAAWDASDWHIQRKPERVQRAVWQTVFDSTYAPTQTTSFRPPWTADSPDWTGLDSGPDYAHTSPGPTTLTWVNQVQRLDDYLSFNEIPASNGQSWDRVRGLPIFPVSDVRLAFGFEPETDTATVSTILATRGHEFRATLVRDGSTTTAVIDLRPDGGDWRQLDVATLTDHTLAAGRVTNIDFWHADQAIWLFADGRLVAGGPEKGAYDWDVAQRLRQAVGPETADAALADQAARVDLARPELYPVPTLRCAFAGSAFTLHRVRVARDLFYRPGHFGPTDWPGDARTAFGLPARATHPAAPVLLGPDEFFMCGDNSPRSLDSRLWGAAHPTVLDRYHTQPGAVHRNLLIGKAFVVYLPGPRSAGKIPILDFGHIRWIW